KGVLVIEAGQKSGGVITTRHAKEQGRGVLAGASHPWHPLGRGTNALIRGGGAPVRSAEGGIEELLGGGKRAPQERPEPVGRDLELLEVLRSLGGRAGLDDILVRLEAPPQKKLASLDRLELAGWIVRGLGTVAVREAD